MMTSDTAQPQLDPDIVNEVLFFTEDLLQRSQIRFLALKDLARQIRETQQGLTPNLHLTAIELGIQQKDLNQATSPMLKGLFKLYNVEPEWTETFIRFKRNGVPVFIKIIQRKYGFFQNPNKAFYRVSQFELPNPFENYWVARHIIK